MKFKYNFIISATILMLLTGTHFFATSECVTGTEEPIAIEHQRKLIEQVNKLSENMPYRDLKYADCGLEYEKYSDDYLLSIIKSGQNITELDNYEKVKRFLIYPKPHFPKLPKDIDKIPNYFFAKCFPRHRREFCIPSGIKSIGRGAFFRSDCLLKVEIPESVETIEKGAFLYCYYLNEVKLSEGLKSIGDRAFECCPNLVKIEIPSSVESIGDRAFCHCPSLEQVILKEGIKSIGDEAFDFTKIEELVIPSTIEHIGKMPWNCKKLVLMNGIERVRKNMTSSCYDLEEIELPDSIKYIDDNAFERKRNLKDIKFPENLTSIGTTCFEGCSSLKEVVIPESIIEIGREAFAECDNLEKVKIPKRFENRLDEIFNGCKSISEITLYDGKGTEKVIRDKDVRDIIKEERNYDYTFDIDALLNY